MIDISDTLWPLVTLAIAVLAYHTVSKAMQLRHGLALAKDVADDHERKLTELHAKSKLRDTELLDVQSKILALSQLIRKLEQETQYESSNLMRSLQGNNERFESLVHSMQSRFDAVEQASTGFGESLANFVNETRGEIDKLKQTHALALQGINQIGNGPRMPFGGVGGR